MNNAILFYFGININEIKKIKNNYYFNYNNCYYIVHYYNRKLEEAKDIFILSEELNKIYKTYQIILTKKSEIIFLYKDNYYILMKYPNIKNRKIIFQDILNFNKKINLSLNEIDRTNWSNNWAKKIDYIEYQFCQIREKYKLIDETIDFYIGMWENALCYFNDHKKESSKVISHIRIDSEMDLFEFLNPLNLVIDYRERDIAEYIKSYIIKNNYSYKQINNFLKHINNENSIYKFISRMLFPSYYFDMYEKIIKGQIDEESIKEIINKKKQINNLLNYIFEYYNNFNVQRIGWIKKEE